MLISDYIASLIENMLNEGDGSIEVRRNDLATKVGCVPSQINYVITSRFTPEKGYYVESRRGGGGYIRIVRADMTKDEYLMHFFHAIGNELDEGNAFVFAANLADRGIVSPREYLLMKSSLSNSSLENVPVIYRNIIRADIMRHMIMTLMNSTK